jgi:hypothetical protein
MTGTKQVSLHGVRAFLTPEDYLVGRGAIAAGGSDKPMIVLPGSPDMVAVFDDFLGDLVGDEWNYVEGDTGSSGAIQAGTNGVFRLLGSVSDAAAPSAVRQINSGALNWKANQGSGNVPTRLRMGARLKIESTSRSAQRQSVFIGFTDVTTAEMPIYDTGGAAGPISAAADAVGFMFGARADTGWSAVSAKSTAGDSGDQLVVLGASYGPSSNVYSVVEVELTRGSSDTGGKATFFVNGIPRGTINSPVNSAVALTPTIACFDEDTGARFVDIDWINVAATRDTGM